VLEGGEPRIGRPRPCARRFARGAVVRSVELAVLGLAISVVVGCVAAHDASSSVPLVSEEPTPGPSLTPHPSMTPKAATQTGPPAPDASGVAGGTTLGLTVDDTLERLLPDHFGEVRFVRHSLAQGQIAPPAFSDALGREMLAQAGRAERDLSVAWIETAPEDKATTFGLTVVAIRIRGAAGRAMLPLALADRLLRPGPKSFLGANDELAGGGTALYAGGALLVSSGDLVLMLTSEGVDPTATTPPNPDSTSAAWSDEEFLAVLPPADRLAAPPPLSPQVVPSMAPDASAPPDPVAEALIPDSIGGRHVQKFSGKGPAVLLNPLVGLPSYVLLMSLDLDPEQLSAAAGHPENASTFLVVATRVPGVGVRALLGGFFAGSLLQGASWDVEPVEMDGRVVDLYGDQAVYATDGLVYWMTYFDVGDFPSASPEPRPSIRDLVEETIRAIS
jgi:hypothetical protein